jgi:hypothetical protein
MTVKRLQYHPLAKVKFPNVEKMQLFLDMISVQEPAVNNVIGFMDGLGLATECTDERITQNAYHCGYDRDTMVNNVLVFGPNGKVFLCAINYRWSWAKGILTAHFFSHITKRIGDYKICVDQGFPQAGDATGILVGPIPERSARWLHCSAHDHLIWLSNIYTSIWQASEWGMGVLQGTFPCCKKCLPTDKDKRRLVLECIIFVHNFWTELVGLNGIAEVFNPKYKNVINIHGYDWIQRYYLQPGDYEMEDEAELMEENFGGNPIPIRWEDNVKGEGINSNYLLFILFTTFVITVIIILAWAWARAAAAAFVLLPPLTATANIPFNAAELFVDQVTLLLKRLHLHLHALLKHLLMHCVLIDLVW